MQLPDRLGRTAACARGSARRTRAWQARALQRMQPAAPLCPWPSHQPQSCGDRLGGTLARRADQADNLGECRFIVFDCRQCPCSGALPAWPWVSPGLLSCLLRRQFLRHRHNNLHAGGGTPSRKRVPQQAMADEGRGLHRRAQELRLAEVAVEALVVRRSVHCSASLVCCLNAAARDSAGLLLAVATAIASQGGGLVSVRRSLAVANGGLCTNPRRAAKPSASGAKYVLSSSMASESGSFVVMRTSFASGASRLAVHCELK